ncbi:MAG TPA: hypothetical protein VHB21_13745, partial [Minicystis sp.]|nr:hypothetical protein [Minicystis sp.]
MTPARYVLRVHAAGLDALVLLNGATAFEAWDPLSRLVEYPLAPWIVEGDNRLEVRLANQELPPDAEPPVFALELHRAHPGGQVQFSSLMTAYRWTENESSLVRGALRPVYEHTFRAAAFEPWAFTGGGPLGPQDRADVERALVAL